MQRVLITGGCGFIGHHFVEHFLKNTDWEIIVLDRLNYASLGFDRLRDIKAFDDKRVLILTADFTKPITDGLKKEIGRVDYILHLGAETHVDNSIKNPEPFVMSNVVGTMRMLDLARSLDIKWFNFFSCYDKETKAFTSEGLKTYDELKEGDIVFTLNPLTRKVEEQPIEKIIIQDYNGEMIKFDNGIINLLTTPNHRIYQSDMSVIEAKDCVGKNISFPIPAGFDGKKELSKDLMYFIGVFLGNGFTAYQEKITENKSGLSKSDRNKIAKDKKTGKFISGRFGDVKINKEKSYRIFLDIPEKDKARRKIEQVLTNLGIQFTKQKGKAGEHLYFSSESWLNFFNQFGRGAKNKHIPRKFLEQDDKLLKELFNGLIDSDGRWENKSFTTTSDKLADAICEIAIKIGYIPNKQKRYSECIFENRVIKGYSWNINFANKRKSIRKNRITKDNYKGKIWCIQVKNKNFLVERNGKFAFAGNTDEVFGPAPEGVFYKEWDRYNSANPYAATKAGAEELCLAYANTYKVPLFITHTMNCFGERQHPEKFIPMTIKKVLNGEIVLIHSDPTKTKSGSRFYIHCRNVASAVHFLLEKAQQRDKYNIVGEKEMTNLEVAQFIADVIGKPLKYEMIDFHSSRPGHDLRYALDGSKMKSMGWELPKNFEESLEKTIKWYLNNPKWL